jgi:hypothetical protein
MIDINPLWWEAGATSLLAAQNGITMFKDKKPAQIPAPSPAVAIGITGSQFVTGTLIIAAAVVLLAAALLASATIVHHGLALAA